VPDNTDAGQRPTPPVPSDYDENPGRVRLARSVLRRHTVVGHVHGPVARHFAAEGYSTGVVYLTYRPAQISEAIRGRGTSSWPFYFLLYSPECVEGEFSEVGLPLYGVLRASVNRLATFCTWQLFIA
jgi:hypothetical protein